MTTWTPPRSTRSKSAAALAVCALATTLVAPFEGRVLHTYPDAVYGWKLPTACDGHTGPGLKPGQWFTEAECDEMQQADLRKTYDRLAPCFGDVAIPDRELAAYLDLAYNLGPSAVCRSSIPEKVKAGRHAEACATISQFYRVGVLDCRIASNHCTGIPRRRAAERAMCEGAA